MTIQNDINKRVQEKMAGIMDSVNGLIGNEGTLSTPLMGLGGAALGGMAGRGLGMGPVGMGLGALLGGGMAGMGSNAINSQNMFQNNTDMALINGISAGLNANDQTDMMQNQAITQTNDAISGITEMLGSIFGGPEAGMDPMQGGMDPMQGGMDPNMMGAPQGQAPAPMQDETDNNGLGAKQGSFTRFDLDVQNRVVKKMAGLARR